MYDKSCYKAQVTLLVPSGILLLLKMTVINAVLKPGHCLISTSDCPSIDSSMDESLQLHFYLGFSLGLYDTGLDMLAGTHSCIKEFVNTNLLLMIIRFEFQIQIDAWILFP